MADSLAERGKAHETQFKLTQEQEFKAEARRNRLLGEWAGAQWGLDGEDLQAYARSVVQSDFDRPGDEDVLDKVLADLRAQGIETDARRLRNRMEELLQEAKTQIMAE